VTKGGGDLGRKYSRKRGNLHPEKKFGEQGIFWIKKVTLGRGGVDKGGGRGTVGRKGISARWVRMSPFSEERKACIWKRIDKKKSADREKKE